MSAEQILENLRFQNSARQKNFYESHKETINAKRRALYAKKHNLPIKEPCNCPEAEVENEPEPEPIEKKLKSKSILTYDKAVEELKALDLKESTFKKYCDDLKRLVKMAECQNIVTCLKSHKRIIQSVNTSEKNNGEPYSINTKKGIYQSILFIIDNLHLTIKKKPYTDQFELFKMESVEHNAKMVEEKPVYPFSVYLEKVATKFGKESKMYLLGLIYDELTVRDNFILKIVKSKAEMSDDKINYLLINKTNMKIIINSYKTDAKYGTITHSCSKSLYTQLKKYIADNNISDYLFGEKPLSAYVSTNNLKINVVGGINVYRHMKITDELAGMKISVEKRKELADKMNHSPDVQLNYLRTHKLILN